LVTNVLPSGFARTLAAPTMTNVSQVRSVSLARASVRHSVKVRFVAPMAAVVLAEVVMLG